MLPSRASTHSTLLAPTVGRVEPGTRVSGTFQLTRRDTEVPGTSLGDETKNLPKAVPKFAQCSPIHEVGIAGAKIR